MLLRNKNQKFYCTAKIILGAMEKTIFSKDEIVKLEETIEQIPDIVKQEEGKMVLDYLMHGRVIQLDQNEEIIYLFGPISPGRVVHTWSIEKNPDLYYLLKDLI